MVEFVEEQLEKIIKGMKTGYSSKYLKWVERNPRVRPPRRGDEKPLWDEDEQITWNLKLLSCAER